MYTQKIAIIFDHVKSHNGSWSQYIRPGKRILGKQIRPNFLRSASLLNKILPTNLGACKPTFHTFYTSHLRWNSSMRRCFYHRDLRQMQYFKIFQEKLHSFNIQNHRSTRGLLAKPFKKFPKSPIRPAGSHFRQAPNFQWTLKELRFNQETLKGFNIIKNLLCLFFI